MCEILIVIPAAGASTRMRGRDKLLEEVDGQPVLARQVRRALATGARVFVPVSRDHPARTDTLAHVSDPNLSVTAIDGREGMSASLRAAAAFAEDVSNGAAFDGLMVLPADMPALETGDLTAVIDAFCAAPDVIVRATSADGQPGHPVVFPRNLVPLMRDLSGDEGARRILTGHEVRLMALPGQRAITDLDTPEDWDTWRAGVTPDLS